MVSAGSARVKALVLAVLAAACAGRSSGRAAATHADVLSAIAHKGVDLVASGRLTAESLPELTYPLERAQAFARAAGGPGAEAPAWRDPFAELLVRYRDFLNALDRVRREHRGAAARAALAASLAAVDAAARRVQAAVESDA